MKGRWLNSERRAAWQKSNERKGEWVVSQFGEGSCTQGCAGHGKRLTRAVGGFWREKWCI
jgi:hypothetical protein